MNEEIVLKRLKDNLSLLTMKSQLTYFEFQLRFVLEGSIKLIEKQQKEMERYKENYISKNKIKEKIKELESHIWKDGYMTKFDRYAIHYLKELLGE